MGNICCSKQDINNSSFNSQQEKLQIKSKYNQKFLAYRIYPIDEDQESNTQSFLSQLSISRCSQLRTKLSSQVFASNQLIENLRQSKDIAQIQLQNNVLIDGDTVIFTHLKTNTILNSHAIKCKYGQKQFEVSAQIQNQTNNLYNIWQIRKILIDNLVISDGYIRNGDNIIVQHYLTQRYLYSNQKYATKNTKKQLVSCSEKFDENNYWTITNNMPQERNQFFQKFQPIFLVHFQTGLKLYTGNQNKASQDEQNKVICRDQNDNNDKWNIEFKEIDHQIQ